MGSRAIVPTHLGEPMDGFQQGLGFHLGLVR
jgi:hypothetical protein